MRHVDTPFDGTAPASCTATAPTRLSIPPYFSAARISLLDRGYVWALVHPRGGGELGRNWWLDGRLTAKRNTFTDTMACAEHLAAEGFADRARLGLRGGSAGGLLVGACITMRPTLFRSAVAEVPFVDVVTTMSDATLPLTANEWDEWGDPRVEPYASYIASYSPYDNTLAADYPALYVTAGLNDPGSATTSRRSGSPGCAPSAPAASACCCMRTEMGAGHGGPSGRYEAWRDEAAHADVPAAHAVAVGAATLASEEREQRQHEQPRVAHEVALAERALRPCPEARTRRVAAVDELAGDRHAERHEQRRRGERRAAGRRCRR